MPTLAVHPRAGVAVDGVVADQAAAGRSMATVHEQQQRGDYAAMPPAEPWEDVHKSRLGGEVKGDLTPGPSPRRRGEQGHGCHRPRVEVR